jgi:hypothetical protein
VGSLPPEFDPAFAKRDEFRELTRESGRMRNEAFRTQQTGAENLLTKAMVSLESGDTDRAEKLIGRVAAMPYDEREEESPGVAAALMLVYNLVAQEFEDAQMGDTRWLEAALEIHAAADGAGKSHLASTINGFVLQDGIYTLNRDAKRRIREVVGDAPLEADVGEGPATTAEHRREVIITSLVRTALALDATYSARFAH